MARTSGEASPRRRTASSARAGLAGIADRDEHVAHEAVAARALDRGAGEAGPEGGIVEAGEVRERRRGEVLALLEADLAPGLRELVPRADGEAIVAAEHAVADAGPQIRRDVAPVLDGEVRDAAARIEPVGRREGVGRADVEAAAA